MAQINQPADGATVSPNFDVEASIIDSDLVKAELSIDGVVKGSLTAAPFTFHVTSLALGSHKLDIKATDATGQTTTTSRTVTVAVHPASFIQERLGLLWIVRIGLE